MSRNFYRDCDVVNFGGGAIWLFVVWRYLLMKKDELCDEPEEMKCEGEGILSSCPEDDEVKRAKAEPPEEGV